MGSHDPLGGLARPDASRTARRRARPDSIKPARATGNHAPATPRAAASVTQSKGDPSARRHTSRSARAVADARIGNHIGTPHRPPGPGATDRRSPPRHGRDRNAACASTPWRLCDVAGSSPYRGGMCDHPSRRRPDMLWPAWQRGRARLVRMVTAPDPRARFATTTDGLGRRKERPPTRSTDMTAGQIVPTAGTTQKRRATIRRGGVTGDTRPCGAGR